jgi:TonB-dependent starch-binding outer membrane protein SusC
MKKLFQITTVVLGLLLILAVQDTFAQGRTISGTVQDENSEAVIGATIMLKGTTSGTITDVNGVYSVEVPGENTILVFRAVGFAEQEILVGTQSRIEVMLAEDIIGIDEVVVIGYGSMKRSDLTGSVSSINSEDIERAKSTSFIESMHGKMPGVHISTQSGEPGSNIEVKIRGANSINGNSSPLYVIDGIQMDVNTDEVASATVGSNSSMNPMANINQSDIESIEILKDASATAIFGSRGANGVVLITTKSGKEGKTVFNYDANMGFAKASKTLDVLSGLEYVDYHTDRFGYNYLNTLDSNNDGVYDDTDTPRDLTGIQTFNWQDEILRTAITHNHNFSASGGTKTTKYSGSVGYLDQQGIVKNNDYARYNARVKVDHNAGRIKTGFNLNSSYSKTVGAAGASGGGNYNGLVQFITLTKPIDISDANQDFVTGGKFIYPTTMIDDAIKEIDLMRIFGNTYFGVDLMDGLELRVEVGGNVSSSKGREFYGKETAWGNLSQGKAVLQENRSLSWFQRDMLTYNKQFGKHGLNLMAAFELNSYEFESFSIGMGNFPDESTSVYDISKGSVVESIRSNKWGTNRLSYLGRANYNYDNRYLATVSMRGDGSDKFGSGNRWGYFPSAALAWRASQEPFLENISALSNLKFRLSYGETGNERIPAYSYFARMQNSYYASDGTLMLGLAPSSSANPDLKWETTVQYNAGLDVGIFENRVSLIVDYFVKQTQDMLLLTPVPAQTGFSQQWTNVGRVDNKGVELMLMTYNIDMGGFKWNTTFNISMIKNEVIDLGDADFIPVTVPGGWFSNVARVIVGDAIGTAYGYVFDGVYQIDDFTWQNTSDPAIAHADRVYAIKPEAVQFPATAVQPGSFKFKDLDGDGIVDEEHDRQVITHSSPKHYGGLNNEFSYKGFDLGIFLEWSYGNEILNVSKIRSEGYQPWMNLRSEFWENRWTPDNPTDEWGTYSFENTTSSFTSSYYAEDASYLRLKNVYLSYALPQDLINQIGLSSLSVYFTATNLKTWTNYSGFDPEISYNNQLLTGFDRLSYPHAKSWSVGIKASF